LKEDDDHGGKQLERGGLLGTTIPIFAWRELKAFAPNSV
jgi:hypothetical protein